MWKSLNCRYSYCHGSPEPRSLTYSDKRLPKPTTKPTHAQSVPHLTFLVQDQPPKICGVSRQGEARTYAQPQAAANSREQQSQHANLHPLPHITGDRCHVRNGQVWKPQLERTDLATLPGQVRRIVSNPCLIAHGIQQVISGLQMSGHYI